MSKSKRSKKSKKEWTPKQWAKFHADMSKILSAMSQELAGIKRGIVQVEKELDDQDAAYAKASSWLDLAASDSEGPFANLDDDGGDEKAPVSPARSPKVKSSVG